MMKGKKTHFKPCRPLSECWSPCLSWLVVALVAVPWVNTQAQDATRFETEILAFEQRDLASPPPADPVLFVGSSSIRVWPDLPGDFNEYPVMNRGFGGSLMSDLLYYFDRVVAVYDPALILVYEGDNDLAGGKSVDQVYDDYLEFLALVDAQLPNADVAFIATKPSPSRSQFLEVTRQLNSRLEALAASDPHLWYVDVFTPMMNDKDQPRPELFGADMLHMNALGYTLWKSVFTPILAEWSTPKTRTLLFDFGDSMLTTQLGDLPDDPCHVWNNITPDIGGSGTGELLGLIDSDNAPTEFGFHMLSPFNGGGANLSGTTESALFPANATSDSLYGNTETWMTFGPVTPSFKLTGLNPERVYNFSFYASRLGASDNRETGFTLLGEASTIVTLDPVNNIDGVAVAMGIIPNTEGEVTISLTPTLNNNNAYHFIYLGAMTMEQIPNQAPIDFREEPADQTVLETRPVTFQVDVNSTPPYAVQWFRNGNAIPGANEFIYTIDLVTLDMDGDLFSASVSNLLYSAFSQAAMLTVVPDVNAPVLLLVDTSDGLTLRLLFDEALNPESALMLDHYGVTEGDIDIKIVDVAIDSDGAILLTVETRLMGDFTVSVSHVQDWAGHEIAPETTIQGENRAPVFLFDFGASEASMLTTATSDPAGPYWNNVTNLIGTSNTGVLLNLVSVGHVKTDVDLVMLSRFNGANQNGTLASTEYPENATRDSLFGNTEAFSGTGQVFPSFKLTGLVPTQPYRITFYASRLGVSDNRETVYTVTGGTSGFAVLNPANNIDNSVTVRGIKADASGEITVSLAPSDKNNNGYHFTYLGVMKVEQDGR